MVRPLYLLKVVWKKTWIDMENLHYMLLSNVSKLKIKYANNSSCSQSGLVCDRHWETDCSCRISYVRIYA